MLTDDQKRLLIGIIERGEPLLVERGHLPVAGARRRCA